MHHFVVVAANNLLPIRDNAYPNNKQVLEIQPLAQICSRTFRLSCSV